MNKYNTYVPGNNSFNILYFTQSQLFKTSVKFLTTGNKIYSVF